MVSVACEVIEHHVPVKLLNKKILTRSCRFKDLVSKTLKMQIYLHSTEPEDDF